jgi:hypothetical protein
MNNKDLCEHTRIRLIAAAIGHQQCTKTAASVVPLPGTERVIAIGTPAHVALALEIAPAPAELMRLGAIMASTLYNLKQQAGKALDSHTCEKLGDLQEQWDAARRKCREAQQQLVDQAQELVGATDSEGGHHD